MWDGGYLFKDYYTAVLLFELGIAPLISDIISSFDSSSSLSIYDPFSEEEEDVYIWGMIVPNLIFLFEDC